MSDWHLRFEEERCAMWVELGEAPKMKERTFTETASQGGHELGIQSQTHLCLQFWLCHVSAVRLLESQLTSLDITAFI